MRILRSQTASASSKETGQSDVTDSVAASSLASHTHPLPLGPATPTQDYEAGRMAVTPVIRRSRRSSAQVSSVISISSPEMRCQFREGNRKAEGKRKAKEPLHEESARKSLPLAEASEVPPSSSDLFPSNGLVDDQVGPSADEVVNSHDSKMLVEAGQVPGERGLHSVDMHNSTMPVEEHQGNQQVFTGDCALRSKSVHRSQVEQGVGTSGRALQSRGQRFLQIARDRALHFAHFDADGNEAPAGVPPPRAGRRRSREARQINGQSRQSHAQLQQIDWPGPFSTARQLVDNRAVAAAARLNADACGSKVSVIEWHPSRVPGDPSFQRRKSRSLQDLCLEVLSNNAESVVSLEGVPDAIRFRISAAFCKRRKMTSKALSLFFQGEPSEVDSLDCTQICEDELIGMMNQLCPARLEKLDLGYCGRALSERCLLTTIARPAMMTLLKSISLRGAYRLSDQGLEALLQASPYLVLLDLTNCSFLTNASVEAVARCVGETLESLVLDGCPNLNGTVFVHDIVRLTKLQKLSLTEVNGVTDEVVNELCLQLGPNLKELCLSRCTSLTDAAIAAIGPCCPSLQVLKLAYLPMLTDIAIAHITDNLRKIQHLDLKRCKFSDEAIAAFATASGASLVHLSLNSVQQVAGQTTMALAKHSQTCLESLDLSFCRLVDDECLGFLADTCLHLQELKLYGCTQVTEKFLNGHSNLNLKVVGLEYCQ